MIIITNNKTLNHKNYHTDIFYVISYKSTNIYFWIIMCSKWLNKAYNIFITQQYRVYVLFFTSFVIFVTTKKKKSCILCFVQLYIGTIDGGMASHVKL